MKIIHLITLLLVLFGGLHIGLLGLIGIDLLTVLFGATGFLNVIYALVTLSTLYHIIPSLTDHMAKG